MKKIGIDTVYEVVFLELPFTYCRLSFHNQFFLRKIRNSNYVTQKTDGTLRLTISELKVCLFFCIIAIVSWNQVKHQLACTIVDAINHVPRCKTTVCALPYWVYYIVGSNLCIWVFVLSLVKKINHRWQFTIVFKCTKVRIRFLKKSENNIYRVSVNQNAILVKVINMRVLNDGSQIDASIFMVDIDELVRGRSFGLVKLEFFYFLNNTILANCFKHFFIETCLIFFNIVIPATIRGHN